MERIQLAVSDGTEMTAHVARPAQHGAKTPGILVFQEAFGVNAHIRDIAERFAAIGFAAIAPELFHRTATGFEGSYGDFEAVRPHMSGLTIPGQVADVRAAAEWLQHEPTVDADRLAAIGFCMGGRVAYLANAHVKLRAAISFYGGGIVPDLLDLAKDQHGALLMFWGGKDTHIPPEAYRTLTDALTQAQAVHEQVVFSQAGHGFFCDRRESYEEGAARQAWAMTQAFLESFGVTAR